MMEKLDNSQNEMKYEIKMKYDIMNVMVEFK